MDYDRLWERPETSYQEEIPSIFQRSGSLLTTLDTLLKASFRPTTYFCGIMFKAQSHFSLQVAEHIGVLKESTVVLVFGESP